MLQWLAEVPSNQEAMATVGLPEVWDNTNAWATWPCSTIQFAKFHTGYTRCFSRCPGAWPQRCAAGPAG